jgi:hypothetical protein
MADDNRFEWWLNNHRWAISDVLTTLQSYLEEVKIYQLTKNNNIVWQFVDMLLKYIRFFTFLKNEWNYKKNNIEVYNLTKDILWMILKDVTVISSNIDEFDRNLTSNDEYLEFMKKFRNILHHQKIGDRKITLKSLSNTLKKINQDITENSTKYFIEKTFKNGRAAFWNKSENDYISVCKLENNSDLDNEITYKMIDNAEEIEEELISYYFTEHLNFEDPIHGELNSLDNFVCIVYISEKYILHIKLIPIIYWGLEKIKNILCP